MQCPSPHLQIHGAALGGGASRNSRSTCFFFIRLHNVVKLIEVQLIEFIFAKLEFVFPCVLNMSQTHSLGLLVDCRRDLAVIFLQHIFTEGGGSKNLPLIER